MSEKKEINVKTLSDLQIIEQVVEQQQTHLFEELYVRYADKVYRKSYSMTQNEEDAKDLTHNVFIKVFTNLSKFKRLSSFSTWIYRITYNENINFIRNRNRKSTLSLNNEDTNFEPIDLSDNEIENRILHDIKLSRLEELLLEVLPEDKAILLMKYQDEMSINDIASFLDISTSAVKMRLMRARNRLYRLFEKKYPNND